MTVFNTDPERGPVLPAAFKNWDAIRKTKDCLHCRGTGIAPSGDGHTECGFCE